MHRRAPLVAHYASDDDEEDDVVDEAAVPTAQDEVQVGARPEDPVTARDDRARLLLPPSPIGEADPDVQENIRQCIEHQRRGHNFNASLRAHELFINPYILETVAKVEGILYGIYEHGTNMPTTMHDPKRFADDEYFDKLAETRDRLDADRQEAARQRALSNDPNRSIEFTAASQSRATPQDALRRARALAAQYSQTLR
ncbi:hypothetical protein PBRA_005241 [Plasmodiophora brassicae]|uniref:Uncharacterized protein n=1 Tax=Plasmodiophora brassicae TaxID=37360 RepID=A0A0G4IN82_PLABS|nr:hypothetical protein PBRA_005241 [Plasmodiophora brassicae]